MNWEEFIGLIISLGAFLYLMFRGAFKAHQDQEEEYEEEEIVLPPPVSKVTPPSPKKKFKAPLPKIHTLDEAPAYEVFGKASASRSHRILSQLKSKKQMIILKEIIGPPKGL